MEKDGEIREEKLPKNISQGNFQRNQEEYNKHYYHVYFKCSNCRYENLRYIRKGIAKEVAGGFECGNCGCTVN